MSERYSKLFALSENLYASGSPVVIAAGALLKDNQTGRIIAQLKLRNISKKAIKAAKVCISPFDTVGNPIGEVVYYQYLDLSAARNEDFGQKAAIALSDAATRSFAATVEEIAFADNTVWRATGEPWEVLPVPSSIGRIHGAEFEKQFRMKYGANCTNLPLSEKDLWYCACGALNRQGEQNCHACGKSHAVLCSIDYDKLNAEKDARLAAEKEQAEKEAEAARMREEVARTKAKKAGKIAAIVIPVLVVIIVAAVVISGMVKKNNAYDGAMALLEAGQYEEAIRAFAALDGYKDSAEQIQIAENAIAEIKRAAELEAAYNNAIELLESDVSANENEAYYILMELGDYKDAKELLMNFQYAIITEYTESSKENNSDYTRSYEYDTRGLLTAKLYDNGRELTYDYDSNGRLVKETGAQYWAITEYSYYDNGIISRIKEAEALGTSGKVEYLTTDYDAYGNPIRIDDDLNGGVWTFTYNYAEDGTISTVDCTRSLTNREDSTTVNVAENGWELYHTAKDWNLIFKETNDNQITTYAVIFDYFDGLVISKRRRCEFDNFGNLTQEITFNDEGKIVLNYSYKNNYDEMGNLTQTKRQSAGSDVTVAYNYIYGYIYTPDAA